MVLISLEFSLKNKNIIYIYIYIIIKIKIKKAFESYKSDLLKRELASHFSENSSF